MENNLKYLNGYTIISYNPNNSYVTLKSEVYTFDNNKWVLNGTDDEDDELIPKNENNNEHEYEYLSKTEETYWIVEEGGINKIKISSNDDVLNSENIKAGPLFSIEMAVLYLNYFNDVGF